MKIAVASTVYKKTPPEGYGGIERVVHTLVEELVRQGHEVTLFAVPGSRSSGTTVPVKGYDPSTSPSGVRKPSDILSEDALYETMDDYLRDYPVDVVHDWSFQNLFPLRQPARFPFVISLCSPPADGYKRPNLVACSEAHAGLCGQSTKYVRYGLDLAKYEVGLAKKEHFIHISKISRTKGQHLAVSAFRKTGKKLVLAGNIEDKTYYYAVVMPMVKMSPNVSYIGEIEEVNRHLCEATALVQTPRWFDAFPFVVLESFASGTPVISLRAGGIPEQIVDGVNGYLCDTVDDIRSAAEEIGSIRPEDCRAYAEEHFTASRMAKEYIDLYQRVMDGEKW